MPMSPPPANLRAAPPQANRLVERLHRWLIPAKPNRAQWGFWFGLSLAVAAIYGVLALKQGFAEPWLVQDDVRQHGFWMRRFLEPGLFPNDPIADYFQAIAPPGYAALYGLAARLGLDPLVFNKILPPVLGLAIAGLAFRVAGRILPVPLAGFLASLLLHQSLWLKDDLISGTSRAFAFPLLLAGFEALLSGSWLGLAGAIALQGWFCPPYVSLTLGVLGLRLLRLRRGGRWGLFWSGDRADWGRFGLGLAVALATVVPYLSATDAYGPVVTAAQGREMLEFRAGGRASLFDQGPLDYWLFGNRTNFFPRSLFTPVTLVLGVLLPGLLAARRGFPLGARTTAAIALLPQLLLASTVMFLAAHGLLFRLHLPSRYTGHSLRLAIALAAGVGGAIALDALLRWARRRPVPALGLAAVLAALLLGYPALVPEFPANSYVTGRSPQLYAFLARQPPDIRVASLSDEGDNLPTFARRSILAGKEYAVPYHLGYYRAIARRTGDTLRAQYADDPAIVASFVRRYGVDFWLVDRGAFSLDYLDDGWLEQYRPAWDEAEAVVEAGRVPVVAARLPGCAVLESPRWVLADAPCLAGAD